MKSISREEFFKQISINSGVSDLETVKNVFYGMIKTISRELKNNHIIKLPDWGDFYLHIHKSRKITQVNTNSTIFLPAKPVVKFSPDKNVKQYFYQLGK